MVTLQTIVEFLTNNYILVAVVGYFILRFLFGSGKGGKFEEYPGHKVTAVTSEEVWADILKRSNVEKKSIVVDFYATWCPPCRRASPVYGKMSTEYPDVIFAKVDVDAQRPLMQMYNVRAMPTFVLVKDGQQVDAVQGWDERRIRSMITRHTAATAADKGQ